jgi:type I restriction enzyme M protein
LPQVTFEPFTSTKTSLLFAQKKTAEEITEWNAHWNKYQGEWSKLNTRVANYISVYLKGEKQEKYPSIKTDNDKTALKNIHYFLKDYLEPKDASLPVREVLEKYKAEIDEISIIDKDTIDLFGYCNSWWVFGEVSKLVNYNIFMGEAENVGYKRTKRGPKPMPNELFDIEAAPLTLDTLKVEKHFSDIAEEMKTNIEEMINTITAKKKKVSEHNGKGKNTDKADKELEKEEKKLEKMKSEYTTAQTNLKIARAALSKHYEKDVLKDKYYERTDKELVDLFTTGILSHWKCEDVLLRKTEKLKILDHLRQSVKWEY